MHIKRFGIKLTRLKEDQIELVRNWRNTQEIRNFMEFQEYITPEMQRNWFHSLDRLHDFYFVIELQHDPVGLIHTSAIDWGQKTGNAGLFIWKKAILGSHVPVLASLAMVDFFFSFCTLEKLYAKVMADNLAAIKYNAQLGFKLADEADHKMFLHYLLKKKDYFKSTSQLHAKAELVGGEKQEIVIESDLLDELKSSGAIGEGHSRALVTVVR